jgi:hypothetical protein
MIFKEKKMKKRVLAGLFAVMMVIAGCEDSGSAAADPAAAGKKPAPGGATDTGLGLNTSSLILGVDGTATLTILGSNADAANTVTWVSSAPYTATVDEDGKVTGVAEGSATITVATADGGKTATCMVIVTDDSSIAGVSVTLDHTSLFLKAGETATLTATVIPEEAAQKVTWMSNNEKVATVDGNGKVTGGARGIAKITVTTMIGGKTATCIVTIPSSVINVASTSDWEYALAAISGADNGSAGNPAVFEIHITSDFNATGKTYASNPVNTTITGEHKKVLLTGTRTISLTGEGSLIRTEAEPNQTFVIDGPTLQGNAGNSQPLVYIRGAGAVELVKGSIQGNTNGASGSNGGGVFVMDQNATFTMSGGTISGNTAKEGGGGGVYVSASTFTKAPAPGSTTSGIIYGYTDSDPNSNKVVDYQTGIVSGRGHAVHYAASGSSADFDPAKKRDTTAGPDVSMNSMNSAISGSSGGWE